VRCFSGIHQRRRIDDSPTNTTFVHENETPSRRRTTERKNLLPGNPYEEIVGFARAVRVGPFVSVGGTAPIGGDGETVGVTDAAAQARRYFEIIKQALETAGADPSHIVRTS